MSWGRALIAVPIAALVLLPGGKARGDWPVGRHDAQRTGAAQGRSDIVTPEERWHYYLGGALSSSGAVSVDVDGDGQEDYVMAAGGALVARRIDNSVAWRVRPHDIVSVLGVSDLDGDGDDEIVAVGATGIVVVEALTGEMTWETPPGLMGMFGGARLADLDGDQLDDLLIVPCGLCCGVPSSWPGAAFGFASGATQPVELWQLPQQTCGVANALTVFDADGDGDNEVLFATPDAYVLLDGARGDELGRTADLGTTMQLASCVAVDVDGAPGDELACIHNYSTYPEDRSIYVLDWNAATLSPLWRTFLAGEPSDELRTIDLAMELGGGARVVVSNRSAADQPWTTLVVEASTGAVLDTLVGELVAGAVPRTGGGSYLLTANAAGLRGWRNVGVALVPAWERAGDEDAVLVVDQAAARRGSISARAAVLPATDRLLVVPRSSLNTLRAIAFTDDVATQTGELSFPLGVRVAASFLFPRLTERPLAVTRSDGFLVPLDEDLVAHLGRDDVQTAGIRTGGFYATGTWRQLDGPPRAGDLDGDGIDEILVGDASGSLVRIDAMDGSLTVPPSARWRVAGASAPALTSGDDSRTAIACLSREETDSPLPSYAVRMLSADGSLVWSSPLPSAPMNDVIPGLLDGDTVPDVVVQWGGPGSDQLHTRALSGVDGTLLWEYAFDPGSGRQPSGIAVGRLLGPSSESVIEVGGSHVTARAGSSGTLVGQSPLIANLNYFLPMLTNVDADLGLEIALTGGYEPLHLLDDDLSLAWTSSDQTQRPYPYGSLAHCGDGRVVLISQSWQDGERLTMTTLSPAGRGEEMSLWLADGDAWVSQEVLDASGAWSGQLTSSTVHEDLSGTGRPSALVGSSDGYLYIMDPCAGAFVSSVRFDGAVGEAVYADTDGDGKDEILVTAGDGEIHALQNHSIDPPKDVLDLDLTTTGSFDVDKIGSDTPLSARWEAVPGALTYEVALVDRNNQFVTSPAWRVVTDPDIEFLDVATDVGGYYRVAVRSVGADGRSVDVASDGVAPDENLDDPGSTGDGCCDGGGAGGGGGVLCASLLALRARRRRPTRSPRA